MTGLYGKNDNGQILRNAGKFVPSTRSSSRISDIVEKRLFSIKATMKRHPLPPYEEELKIFETISLGEILR